MMPEEAAVLPDVGDVVVNHYARTKSSSDVQAEELVRHFHRVFHAVPAHEPQTRETNQALALVSQYGLEKATHIIDFAAVEAVKTKFLPQNFGAVLNYASRAAADFDQGRAQKITAAAPTRPEENKPSPSWPRGEGRLAVLTADQYKIRFEQAKAELFRQVPFLAGRSASAGNLVDSMVRSHVIRRLDQESMDLLPLEVLNLPEPLGRILAVGAVETSPTTL
jgi:hypothetical protein